jgi:hypothetical protein
MNDRIAVNVGIGGVGGKHVPILPNPESEEIGANRFKRLELALVPKPDPVPDVKGSGPNLAVQEILSWPGARPNADAKDVPKHKHFYPEGGRPRRFGN